MSCLLPGTGKKIDHAPPLYQTEDLGNSLVTVRKSHGRQQKIAGVTYYTTNNNTMSEAGFEPTTSTSGGWRSIQLSYPPKFL